LDSPLPKLCHCQSSKIANKASNNWLWSLRSNKRIGLREPEDVAHHLFDSIIRSRSPWKVDVWRRTIQFFFSPSDSGSENFQRFLVSNNSYKPITNTVWVCARLCKLQKGYTWLAAASDKVYQLLAHGRWFSLGTPASSITTTQTTED
jgi:hypothetical protein